AFMGPDRELAARALVAKLATDAGVTILGSPGSWRIEPEMASGLGLIAIDLSPGFEGRLAAWRSSLDGAGIVVAACDVGGLADRSNRPRVLVEEAIRRAQRGALARASGTGAASDLSAGARARCSQAPPRPARKTDPRHCWSDLVLPDDTLAQLGEIVQMVA